jgi:phage tail tape-measure protein
LKHIHIAAAALAFVALPLAAHAQSSGGVAAGATTGAVGGAIVGGPVGAVVGGAVGAIVGSGLSAEQQPRVQQYVVQQRHPSYRYQDEVRVGAVLPSSGVQYYEFPADYGVTQYRYTYVNDRAVLVDPRTRQIIQVIE